MFWVVISRVFFMFFPSKFIVAKLCEFTGFPWDTAAKYTATHLVFWSSNEAQPRAEPESARWEFPEKIFCHLGIPRGLSRASSQGEVQRLIDWKKSCLESVLCSSQSIVFLSFFPVLFTSIRVFRFPHSGNG